MDRAGQSMSQIAAGVFKQHDLQRLFWDTAMARISQNLLNSNQNWANITDSIPMESLLKILTQSDKCVTKMMSGRSLAW